MPASFEHELVVELLRSGVEMLPDLLTSAGQTSLPAGALRVESGALSDLAPAALHADLVVSSAAPNGDRCFVTILEVQRQPDSHKHLVWPAYVALARLRYRCQAHLLVVTFDRRTETWARRPISLGPGGHVDPSVLGPSNFPRITDPRLARLRPELAVLSALTHAASDENLEVALAATHAADALPEEHAKIYLDLILESLPTLARATLETFMLNDKYEYKSDFAKRYIALGRAEGEALGKAEAILAVLGARGYAVPEALERRISDCKDLAQLTRWLHAAVSVDAPEQLFDD